MICPGRRSNRSMVLHLEVPAPTTGWKAMVAEKAKQGLQLKPYAFRDSFTHRFARFGIADADAALASSRSVKFTALRTSQPALKRCSMRSNGSRKELNGTWG